MSTTILISGVTAAGKTTLANLLRTEFGIQRVITVTTRKPREGEIDGKDYCFVTEVEFSAIEASGGFAETNTFSGSRYGTRVADLEHKHFKVLVLDPNGHRNVKALLKSKGLPYVSVFLDVDETIQATRFLQRVRENLAAANHAGKSTQLSLRSDATRLGQMLSEEAHWRDVARCEESPYDLVALSYGPSPLAIAAEINQRAINAYGSPAAE